MAVNVSSLDLIREKGKKKRLLSCDVAWRQKSGSKQLKECRELANRPVILFNIVIFCENKERDGTPAASDKISNYIIYVITLNYDIICTSCTAQALLLYNNNNDNNNKLRQNLVFLSLDFLTLFCFSLRIFVNFMI